MKRMTMKLVVLGVLAMNFAGCDKNEDAPPRENPPVNQPPVAKLVKKISAAENDYFAYSYNADKTVNTYVSSWVSSVEGTVRKYEINYTYEAGKLQEASTTGGKQYFTYENGKLASAGFRYPNGVLFATHEYSYDSYNRLVQVIEYIENPDEIMNNRILLEYNAQGNLSRKIKQFRRKGQPNYELMSTEVFEEYDTKWYPIPGDVWGQFLPGLVMHRNNPKRIRDLLPDGSTRQVVHMSYEYGADGYPVSQEQHIEINGQHKPAILYTYEY